MPSVARCGWRGSSCYGSDLDRRNHGGVMAAEARADVHRFALCCLLGLFDAAAADLADWSEFDAEAECWGIEVRGLSREHLSALIAGST
jgi:hypothetical protein